MSKNSNNAEVTEEIPGVAIVSLNPEQAAALHSQLGALLETEPLSVEFVTFHHSFVSVQASVARVFFHKETYLGGNRSAEDVKAEEESI